MRFSCSFDEYHCFSFLGTEYFLIRNLRYVGLGKCGLHATKERNISIAALCKLEYAKLVSSKVAFSKIRIVFWQDK